MTLLDQIKADREAGTPGPWMRQMATKAVVTLSGGTLFKIKEKEEHATPIVFVSGLDGDGIGEGQSNASRIARVPDMETALLAAGELADEAAIIADALDYHLCDGGNESSDLRRCLAAFRNAIEVK